MRVELLRVVSMVACCDIIFLFFLSFDDVCQVCYVLRMIVYLNNMQCRQLLVRYVSATRMPAMAYVAMS